MKIKIAIVIDHLGLGGAQRQVVEYLKNVNREAFNVEVITLDDKNDLFSEEIEELGFSVKFIQQKGFFDLRALNELTGHFRQTQPDIVHTYLFTADCYGRLAARLAKVYAIISSVRSMDKWKKAHHMLADRILAKFTDTITINAENIRSFLTRDEKITKTKIVKIYNGIDLSRFDGSEPSTDLAPSLGLSKYNFVIGIVGRLNKQKDHMTLIQAVEKLKDTIPQLRCLIIGDGPKRAELKQIIDEKGLSNRFIFTGQRQNIPRLIQLMDVGILTTHYEGCPNAILEYMASSKPVIASDVDGCSEIVEDWKTGILVPKCDADALAERIEFLFHNENFCQEFGQEGLKRVEENFSCKALAQNYESLYKELSTPKIAFLLSQFPEMHETFILREFTAQTKQRLNYSIYSYKRCKDKIVHPEASRLLDRTHYVPYVYLDSIIYSFLINPIGFLKGYFVGLSQSLTSFTDFIKFHVVFTRSLYFVRLMKKHKIKHIHAHWATMPTTGAEVISNILNIPFSFTAHAWDIYLNNKFALKNKIKQAQFAVTCTKANKDYLNTLLEEDSNGKVSVNYHGVDLRTFPIRESHSRSSNIILSVGRLVEQKGFEYLIKSCGILQRKSVKFKCIIVGDGPLRAELKNLIANLGLKHCIELRGTVSQAEIKELFSDASVFCAPSVIARNGDRDGIPNVILEALAKGVPVVATRVSGIPEVVVNRQTGLLVSPKDDRALSNALEYVLKNHESVEQFRVNGRKKIEDDFDVDKNVTQLVDIFKEHGLVVGSNEN